MEALKHAFQYGDIYTKSVPQLLCAGLSKILLGNDGVYPHGHYHHHYRSRASVASDWSPNLSPCLWHRWVLYTR